MTEKMTEKMLENMLENMPENMPEKKPDNVPARKHRLSERTAAIGLMIAALFWGLSYPLTKYVEACPTFYIISLRFGIAALCLAAVFHRKFRLLNKDVIKYAFLLSFAVFLMFAFGIWGIKYTTSVRSSFFTTLSFLMIPVLNRILFKIRISRIIVISALLCLVGVFLLCYAPGMGGLVINSGDLLCLLAAVAGSVHIILVEKVSKNPRVDSSLFTVFLMAFISLWGTLIALFTGDIHYSITSSSQLIAIILMGLFCSAVSFCLQSHLEAFVSPDRVGVIFALEPASGCILSVLLLGEQMRLTGWLGAAIIMASILYMEFSSGKEAGGKEADGK